MGRLEEFVRSGARLAGRRFEEARVAYRQARSLPRSDGGVRIVCRRYAEKRVVELEEGVPHCFEADHPACQGCLEDVRDGSVETW